MSKHANGTHPPLNHARDEVSAPELKNEDDGPNRARGEVSAPELENEDDGPNRARGEVSTPELENEDDGPACFILEIEPLSVSTPCIEIAPLSVSTPELENEDGPASITPEIASLSVNDKYVDAAAHPTPEFTSLSVNTEDVAPSTTFGATSSLVKGEDTAASTTSEATAQENSMPENAVVHANFQTYLEHCVRAYRNEKYPSKKGIAILSDNEVKRFLNAAEIRCVATYNKKPSPRGLQNICIRNASRTPAWYNYRDTHEERRLDRTTKTRESGISVGVGLCGGSPASITVSANHGREKRDTMHTQQISGIETEAKVTVKTHQDVAAVEETDTATYYDAVGLFEFKVKNPYKIKYSLQSTREDSFPSAVTKKISWRRVDVRNLPGIKKSPGPEVTTNVDHIVLSGFVDTTILPQ